MFLKVFFGKGLPTETILPSSEIIVNSPNLTRQHGFALYLEGLARALYECGDLDKARQECEKISPLTVGRLRHGGMYLSLGSIPVVLGGIGSNILPGVAELDVTPQSKCRMVRLT